jgi:protein required for attachment to host cells
VIVAAGKVLGQLRQHYHKETVARIIVEIDKVMTGYSTDRIAKMLVDQEEVV